MGVRSSDVVKLLEGTLFRNYTIFLQFPLNAEQLPCASNHPMSRAVDCTAVRPCPQMVDCLATSTFSRAFLPGFFSSRWFKGRRRTSTRNPLWQRNYLLSRRPEETLLDTLDIHQCSFSVNSYPGYMQCRSVATPCPLSCHLSGLFG